MLSYCILGYFYYFCHVEDSVNHKNFNIEMKKLFSLALVAILSLAVSCELLQNEQPTPNNAVLELTSASTIDVACEGGTFAITYKQTGEGNVIATTDNNSMIDAVSTNSKGVVRISVTANPYTESREANVIIACSGSSLIVKVVQAGVAAVQREVVNIAANQLVGNYYGEKFGAGKGHYWIILTKDGFVNGATVVNGEYIRLDVIAPVPSDAENITLPDGDYTFDASEYYELYTIKNLGNTDYSWTDSNMEGWAEAFVDATLSVRGNRFELVAMTQSKEFHVTFEGTYKLTPPYEITDYVSSLTKDTVIDVSNCSAYCTSQGDYWKCGYTNWYIEFVCNDGFTRGTYVVIDYISDSAIDCTGIYVSSGFTAEDPTKPDFRPGVFVPGFRVSSDSDLLLGSLFMVYKDGLCVSQAPLYDGTITITKNANGTHNIVIDALDDAPKQNKITLNWTGYLN